MTHFSRQAKISKIIRSQSPAIWKREMVRFPAYDTHPGLIKPRYFTEEMLKNPEQDLLEKTEIEANAFRDSQPPSYFKRFRNKLTKWIFEGMDIYKWKIETSSA